MPDLRQFFQLFAQFVNLKLQVNVLNGPFCGFYFVDINTNMKRINGKKYKLHIPGCQTPDLSKEPLNLSKICIL